VFCLKNSPINLLIIFDCYNETKWDVLLTFYSFKLGIHFDNSLLPATMIRPDQT